MPRRHPPEQLSPRALARLRAGPRSYVPTELDLAIARPVRGGTGARESAAGAPSWDRAPEAGAPSGDRSVRWVGRAGSAVAAWSADEGAGATAVRSPGDEPGGG